MNRSIRVDNVNVRELAHLCDLTTTATLTEIDNSNICTFAPMMHRYHFINLSYVLFSADISIYIVR